MRDAETTRVARGADPGAGVNEAPALNVKYGLPLFTTPYIDWRTPRYRRFPPRCCVPYLTASLTLSQFAPGWVDSQSLRSCGSMSSH